MRDLVRHVLPHVAARWYDLGLQLLHEKNENELTFIESDATNDIKTCCRKMFAKWKETDELASWDKLIDALKSIGLNTAASDLKKLLRQGEYVASNESLSLTTERSHQQ